MKGWVRCEKPKRFNKETKFLVVMKVWPGLQNLKDLTKKPRKWVSIDSVSKKVEPGVRNQMI